MHYSALRGPFRRAFFLVQEATCLHFKKPQEPLF